ncbi:hypothetical protein C8J57DRAFT_1260793 [Mycena rebaudengoi]|nr:hypothetical protein C8J57DRAFT_1260793 [Mycena rebaudengoi]
MALFGRRGNSPEEKRGIDKTKKKHSFDVKYMPFRRTTFPSTFRPAVPRDRMRSSCSTHYWVRRTALSIYHNMSEKGGKKRVEEMSHHWTGSERDAESPMLQTSFLRCGMLVEEKVRHRAQIMSEWRQWRRLHATFGGCGEYLMFNSGGGGGRRGRLTSGVWLGAEFEYAEDQEHLGNGQNGNRETGISGISGGIGGSITKCHSACDRHAIGVQYKHLSLGSITVVHWAQVDRHYFVGIDAINMFLAYEEGGP